MGFSIYVECNTKDNSNMKEESKGIFLVEGFIYFTWNGQMSILSILWKVMNEY